MNYRDRIVALAAQWKLGPNAEPLLALLPAPRRSGDWPEASDPAARLAALARKETRRVNAWGRRRYGSAWDRLDPRVRAQLVKQNGRDH